MEWHKNKPDTQKYLLSLKDTVILQEDMCEHSQIQYTYIHYNAHNLTCSRLHLTYATMLSMYSMCQCKYTVCPYACIYCIWMKAFILLNVTLFFSPRTFIKYSPILHIHQGSSDSAKQESFGECSIISMFGRFIKPLMQCFKCTTQKSIIIKRATQQLFR